MLDWLVKTDYKVKTIIKNEQFGMVLFLAPKVKYCLTINKFGVIDEHKTYKGFLIVNDNLDRKEYFNMANGGKLKVKFPLSWKKSFNQGFVIPYKMETCCECKKNILSDNCDQPINRKKDFSVNLNELKRESTNEFGHMLPKYITTQSYLLTYKWL